MKQLTGILLVNLGTPDSPSPKDVYRYLIEFLSDSRVIDLSWPLRQWLVRGMIVPSRYKQSSKAYQHIWTNEGSPLMVFGRKMQKSLQDIMGVDYCVELAMRYKNPSIKKGIAELINKGIRHLIVLPLFPQYASSTTGSVQQSVMEIISQYDVIPKITFIDQFATHPGFIRAFCSVASQYSLEKYDHILFSFHGLPEKHIQKADPNGWCLKQKQCCETFCRQNQSCYSAQCFATAKGIAKELNLETDRYSLCFQSRLGKDPWLQPYTSNVLAELARNGAKKILVFCPSFVCDCLETIYEIKEEYAQEFLHAGGEQLDLVQGLNDHPHWIEGLKQIIFEHSKF